MRFLKLLFILTFSGVLLNSCTATFDEDIRDNEIILEALGGGYDLWYVDYHKTIGQPKIPFLSRAFTLSFVNGVLYANNNIAAVGFTGNGLGIAVGSYNTFSGVLETRHDIDGRYDFELTAVSPNEIRLYNYRNNVTYFLIGYQRQTFDYDKLFYDNIEYFLQEYEIWEKQNTVGGVFNAFDAESYLQFTPENAPTFYSSKDAFGTKIEDIYWNYVEGYEIFDLIGFDDLKIIRLNYCGGFTEDFELSIISDEQLQLYSLRSESTYIFKGIGFLQYLKEGNIKASFKNATRERLKVNRKNKNRRVLK